MKMPGEGSSTSGSGKKRHKRRAQATSEGSSGPNECSGSNTCELCSSPALPARAASGDKKGVHNSPLLRGQADPSLVTRFYCKVARLHGVIHHRTQATLSGGSADFTEDGVLSLGNQVADVVAEALSITRRIGSLSGDGGSSNGPGNPFVMLLSILLPPLRKFLAWTWTTRSVWYGAAAPSSIYQQHAVFPAPAADNTARSNASNGSSRSVVSNPVLWTMLAQHDVISRLTALLADVSRLIERNEDESRNSTSSTSLASSRAALPAPSSAGSVHAVPIPQVHHIALELEGELFEYRVCLAELTECLVENMETIAGRLCRPVLGKDVSKARGSATEFVELLVLQVLDPVAKRFVEAPSPSRLYLFPRLLDKCISVVIHEFILRPGVRMNEIAAAQVEKGAMFLRTWSLRIETDYNTRARALASASPDVDPAHSSAHHRLSWLLRGGSGDFTPKLRDPRGVPRRPESPASSGAGPKLQRANTSQDDIRGRLEARLELTSLDGFKRLDGHIKQWLRNERGDSTCLLPAVRSRGGNLAEGLRESIARTFTARSTGVPVRSDGQ